MRCFNEIGFGETAQPCLCKIVMVKNKRYIRNKTRSTV